MVFEIGRTRPINQRFVVIVMQYLHKRRNAALTF